jgi:hypothetical protein
MDAIPDPQCPSCGEPLPKKSRGRPQRFCSDACRQAHRKIALTSENGLRYRTGRAKQKSDSQTIELEAEFKPKNLSPKTDLPLQCEKVNEVTYKITNGEFTNVPASRGQWGGYRTTKALAWITKLGPDAWVARCGDHICNPTSFKEAKSQALAMARDAMGDYFVPNPIPELNQLEACFLSRHEDAESD